MRSKAIVAGVVGAMVFASFGGIALASDTGPTNALSTRLGGTTCASFMHMSKARQDRLVHRMRVAAPKTSIVSATTAQSGNTSTNQSSGQTPAAGPLQASDVAAACQSATPKVAIRDAYATFSTGAGISANH